MVAAHAPKAVGGRKQVEGKAWNQSSLNCEAYEDNETPDLDILKNPDLACRARTQPIDVACVPCARFLFAWFHLVSFRSSLEWPGNEWR